MFSNYLFLTPIENSNSQIDSNFQIEDDEFSCLKAKEEMKRFIKYSLSISRPESINLTNNSHLSIKRIRKTSKTSRKESKINESQVEKEKISKIVTSNWKNNIFLLKKSHISYKDKDILSKAIGKCNYSYENVY
jgi:hypothetical protein